MPIDTEEEITNKQSETRNEYQQQSPPHLVLTLKKPKAKTKKQTQYKTSKTINETTIPKPNNGLSRM